MHMLNAVLLLLDTALNNLVSITHHEINARIDLEAFRHLFAIACSFSAVSLV